VAVGSQQLDKHNIYAYVLNFGLTRPQPRSNISRKYFGLNLFCGSPSRTSCCTRYGVYPSHFTTVKSGDRIQSKPPLQVVEVFQLTLRWWK
jgi:hypothetical protein